MVLRVALLVLMTLVVKSRTEHWSHLSDMDNDTLSDCVEELKWRCPVLKVRLRRSSLVRCCRSMDDWYQDMAHVELPTDYLLPHDFDYIMKLTQCQDVYSCLSNVPLRSRIPRQTSVGRAVRQEIRLMSDEARLRFFNAVNRMKADRRDGMSRYDLFVTYHTSSRAPAAHFGASFLPWHREYLRQFEIALRSYDPQVSIPYWDSTLDQPLPNPAHSVLFSELFLGNAEGSLVTGPFRRWSTAFGEPVERHCGRSGSLFSIADVAYVLRQSTYDQLTFCVDPFFETVRIRGCLFKGGCDGRSFQMHGAVHEWVGGHMAIIPMSPNDPVFLLLHSFIDSVWELFRQSRQTPQQRESSYPPDASSCSDMHGANGQMLPFLLRNIDGLSNSYTDQFYVYDSLPSCSPRTPTCRSPYVFCDVRQYVCVSKVVPGGNCQGFEGTDICYHSTCVRGTCV
ncbi:unnamed protein product [Soboliphyme baturini]|uniref:Tyrosinase_Cu-bd domain-containing protein n=1 Tax=Soboliphyme baturini TaxID=241478 RepID=A0A183IUG5_9BILA|nr:unnamed protein product [Soboliphyme baturini]